MCNRIYAIPSVLRSSRSLSIHYTLPSTDRIMRRNPLTCRRSRWRGAAAVPTSLAVTAALVSITYRRPYIHSLPLRPVPVAAASRSPLVLALLPTLMLAARLFDGV
jgi:hypothetical protein